MVVTREAMSDLQSRVVRYCDVRRLKLAVACGLHVIEVDGLYRHVSSSVASGCVQSGYDR